MGQGQQKPTINPNQPNNYAPNMVSPTNANNNNNNNSFNNKNNNQQNNNNQNFKVDRFVAYIRQALRNCSTNGHLTKDSFNQVLAVLQNLNFKRLRDTPLADRLFNLLDTKKNGRVTQQDFSKCMTQIVNDKNAALTYTFRAYDSDGDNCISKKQFTQLIQDSWRAAFRILAQKCDGTQHNKLTIRDLQSWAASKIQTLNENSSKLFSKLDAQNKNYIEFQVFKEFVINGGYNDITASINGEKVVIPLNLTSLYVGA